MSDANKKLIQEGFDAFSAGDMERMAELFTPDVKWHTPGNNPLAGDHEGLENVLGLFAKVSGEAEMSIDVHAILADDEHGVALLTSTAKRGDKTFSGQSAFAYHFAGGKVSEVWTLSNDQAGIDAFWSD